MTSAPPSATAPGNLPVVFPVVFYDGVCGLCNHVVQFLIRKDHRKILFFAPLQGPTALKKLSASDRGKLSSLVLVDSSGIFRKSDAILRIATETLSRSNPLWKGVKIFKLFPRYLRDLIYDWVARNRYHWFGKHESCPLPDAKTRERFLP